MMHMLIKGLLLALLPLVAGAQDFYYQSVMPDGRTVIGDKPAPGAKEVRKVPLSKGNVSAPLARPEQQQQAPVDRQGALETADADVRQAQRDLDVARAALEAGREPRPGERIGTASGGSRFTEAYLQRIKGLEDAVALAQKRLDEAYARRKAAR